MNNYFKHSPSAGSHDANPSYDDLQAKIQQLEARLAATERQQPIHEEQPRKTRWGKKIRKFFRDIVIPILVFIPKFLNSLADFKKAAKAENINSTRRRLHPPPSYIKLYEEDK